MRTKLSFLASLLLLALAPLEGQAPLRVVSFNIRYGTANDGAHAWPERRAHTIALIHDHAPHLLGLQEALHFQLTEINAALPTYRVIGSGREDGKEKGEYAAILVDTARFDVLKDGQFWFSDTPDVPGSMSWGNRITRICTWVRLVDRATGDTTTVFNLHFDHQSQPSREKSAELLIANIPVIAGNDGVVLMGDFNSGETNPAFVKLVNDNKVGLRDTYRMTHPDEKIVGTFHDFRGDSTGDKIDAVLVNPRFEVLSTQIDRRRFGALWPSDHFAVTAVIRSKSRATD